MQKIALHSPQGDETVKEWVPTPINIKSTEPLLICGLSTSTFTSCVITTMACTYWVLFSCRWELCTWSIFSSWYSSRYRPADDHRAGSGRWPQHPSTPHTPHCLHQRHRHHETVCHHKHSNNTSACQLTMHTHSLIAYYWGIMKWKDWGLGHDSAL